MCPHSLRTQYSCSPQGPLSRCPTPVHTSPQAPAMHPTGAPGPHPRHSGTLQPLLQPCSLLPPGPQPTPLSPAVQGTTVTPRGVLVLIPRTCGHAIFRGKWDYCADMVRSRILRWKDCPGSPGWTQCHHKGSQKKKAGGSESEKQMGRWKQQLE